MDKKAILIGIAALAVLAVSVALYQRLRTRQSISVQINRPFASRA
jgi:hypothetical protein